MIPSIRRSTLRVITPLASGWLPVTPDVGLPVPNVEELYIGADGVVDQNCDQPGQPVTGP